MSSEIHGNHGVVLSPLVERLEVPVKAVEPFTSDDFRSAGLGRLTPDYYSNTGAAAAHEATLSEFGIRFALERDSGSVEARVAAGIASLMDKNANPLVRVARKLHLDSPPVGLSRVRTVNSWFNREVVDDDPEAFSDAIMEELANYARSVGMRALEVMIEHEDKKKNQNLVVVEHTANLERLGFKPRRARTMRDQGNIFGGPVFRLKL